NNPMACIGKRQDTLGVHVLSEYVINVVKDYFVIKHRGCLLDIRGSITEIIPQKPCHASFI
ncbi:hypothetical protein, partial [Serratia microhaemolytica]|uniref:hypothetical protein n=1 Tax=Serratia microhaemolytica TaxID=2675110 RepID=UPI00197EB590